MTHTLSASLTVTTTGGTSAISYPVTTVTASGGDMVRTTQSIGTSAEAIVLGDLATAAVLAVYNTDATNYIEVDSVNTMDKFPQKIPAGGFILLRPQTTTIYAKANTAACVVEILACEL